jgi:hypothetical protein
LETELEEAEAELQAAEAELAALEEEDDEDEEEDDEDMPVIAIEDEEVEHSPRNGVSAAARKMREDEEDSLRAKIEALGGSEDITVKLHRVEPREIRHKGERINISGLCSTYAELPTDAQIEDAFGGGTYRLIVNKANGRYFGSKQFKIAGRPKIDAYVDLDDEPTAAAAVSVGSAESDALSMQALKTMKELIDQKKEGGVDMTQIMAMIQAANAPLLSQIEAANQAAAELRRELAAKDAKMFEIATAKPDTSKEDNLLKEVWNSDSRRLESIREAHQSEMRIMREHHEAALSRLDDRHKDDIKTLQRSHEREIDSIKDSHKQAIEALKLAYESRIDGFKSDVERLNRDLTESKAEIGSLRSIKEKGLVEQASELAQVGDALKAIGIGNKGDDEEGNKKWYERMFEAAAENPEVIATIMGGPNAGPPQQMQSLPQPQMQPQLPPVGQPFQAPDGQAYVRIDEQTVVPLEQAQQMAQQHMQAQQAQQAQPPAAGQPEQATRPAARPPEPAEVKKAILFMEMAYSNGTNAESFAQTAKASIPYDILAYMEQEGIENFLNKVAVLDKSSPLRNIAGRKWMREVGNFLLKGQAG